MIWKGYRFGMLLQLAVGPMCILVFDTSASDGLLQGLFLVIAITLIDGLYIILSGLGVAAIINKEKIKFMLKLFGGIVLVLFGASTIAGAFGMSLLPSVQIIGASTGQNVFIKGLILTASNPLTIIFWSGVFSTQVVQRELKKQQLFAFGFGCVLSTLCFLSAIAVLGSVISGFLPQSVIQVMNVVVGGILIIFGVRLVLKRENN